MMTVEDQAAHALEQLHIALLGRDDGMCPKVRQHLLDEIGDVSHLELEGLVRPVWSDVTTTPSIANDGQKLCSVFVLADRETRSHLPAESMSLTRLERDTETAFSIYETGDVVIKIH